MNAVLVLGILCAITTSIAAVGLALRLRFDVKLHKMRDDMDRIQQLVIVAKLLAVEDTVIWALYKKIVQDGTAFQTKFILTCLTNNTPRNFIEGQIFYLQHPEVKANDIVTLILSEVNLHFKPKRKFLWLW